MQVFRRLGVFVVVLLCLGYVDWVHAATPMVATGDGHTLLLNADGLVWAMGENSDGQLGIGSTMQRSAPTPVVNMNNAIAVAAGGLYSLGLKNDGTVWAWGNNDSGQLGNGLTTAASLPTRIASLSNIVVIAAANDWALSHAVALDGLGIVWTWGENGAGELGRGRSVTGGIPAQVQGLNGVAAIAAGGGASDGGGGHTLVVKSDGTVWSWGNNSFGQLGDGTLVNRAAPVQVKGLSDVSAIAAGYCYSLALKRDGTVWTWGWNGAGPNLGKVPIQVAGLHGIVAIASGVAHNLALTRDGALFAWGTNWSGELGNGTHEDRLTPVRLLSSMNVAAMGAGAGTSAAVLVDGTVMSWGGGYSGQSGDGTFAERLLPVPVVNPSLDGYLNLKTGSTATVSPELQVPFFVVTTGGITKTTATVNTNTRFQPADVGRTGSVFVSAMAPANSVLTSLAVSGDAPRELNLRADLSGCNFVQVQLTQSG